MATYYLRATPVTTIKEIQTKLTAFTTLYGETIVTLRSMRGIDTSKGAIFPVGGVKVQTIGKKYLMVECEGAKLRVNLNNPNHGIEEIMFMTKN
jgi:hypothetical protein